MQWHRVKNQCFAARTRSAALAAVEAAHMQCSVRITATRGRCSTQCNGTAAFRRAQAVRLRLRSEQSAFNAAYASLPLVAGAVRNAMARRAKPVPYSAHTQCSAGCRQSSSHAMQRTHHCHSWQVQYAMQWHGCLAARTSSAAPAAVRAAHIQCSVRITATRGRCSTQCNGTA